MLPQILLSCGVELTDKGSLYIAPSVSGLCCPETGLADEVTAGILLPCNCLTVSWRVDTEPSKVEILSSFKDSYGAQTRQCVGSGTVDHLS